LSDDKKTILVVDDEPTIRLLFSRILTKSNYNVLTAENGYKAVDIYKEEPNNIDLVILDMAMPGISGEQTFNLLKEIDDNVKAYILSGYNLKGDIDRILEAGALGYFQKPVSRANLLQFIEDVFKS
jgi:two-component system cell cycle sensor histidine kinase/response regulator CckA